LQTLSHDAYLALRANATVLELDLHGEKVLQLEDGSYLKLFRRKRLISSAAWYPYAQRFADNAIALAQRGIPCPSVIAVYRIAEIARDAVHYWPLAGRSLRQLIQQGAVSESLRGQLLSFVGHLHAAGIYFRSLHLGNIILMPQGTLGLIDIADMQIKKRPLFQYQRRRNMAHLHREPGDRAWLCRGDDERIFHTTGAANHE
jgi:tRNA A-37 threonylcarbamoyl transferase component Bud32